MQRVDLRVVFPTSRLEAHYFDPPSSTAKATASLENSSMWSKLNSGEMSMRLEQKVVRRPITDSRKVSLVAGMDVLVGVLERALLRGS